MITSDVNPEPGNSEPKKGWRSLSSGIKTLVSGTLVYIGVGLLGHAGSELGLAIALIIWDGPIWIIDKVLPGTADRLTGGNFVAVPEGMGWLVSFVFFIVLWCLLSGLYVFLRKHLSKALKRTLIIIALIALALGYVIVFNKIPPPLCSLQPIAISRDRCYSSWVQTSTKGPEVCDKIDDLGERKTCIAYYRGRPCLMKEVWGYSYNEACILKLADTNNDPYVCLLHVGSDAYNHSFLEFDKACYEAARKKPYPY
jgi:hypothetical protein